MMSEQMPSGTHQITVTGESDGQRLRVCEEEHSWRGREALEEDGWRVYPGRLFA
jgi:hypothetical protein